jgi:hypothetical protein
MYDEIYPMVKPTLPFEDFDQGGQTAYVGWSNRSRPVLPILGVNTYNIKIEHLQHTSKTTKTLSTLKMQHAFEES